MSSEDFTKKSDRVRKELNTLRKDINYRDEQEQRGEATYTIDAEINGQFRQIVKQPLLRKKHLKILKPLSTTSVITTRITISLCQKPTDDSGPINNSSTKKTPSKDHTMRCSKKRPTKESSLQQIQKQNKQ